MTRMNPAASLPGQLSRLDRHAHTLLARSALVLGEARWRIDEVELYLHTPEHPDPFVHRQPEQAQLPSERPGFYFHRVGRSFRGGTFKGMDVVLDGGLRGEAGFGSFLVRSLRVEGGPAGSRACICGPSLCVDHLLAVARLRDVAALAAAAQAGQLALRPAEARPVRAVRTARVGLTLKRDRIARLPFLFRPYRWVLDARGIHKGRAQVLVALHLEGLDAKAIAKRTGSPLPHVRRTVEAFERGRGAPDVADGAARSGYDPEAHGAWYAQYGRRGDVPAP